MTYSQNLDKFVNPHNGSLHRVLAGFWLCASARARRPWCLATAHRGITTPYAAVARRLRPLSPGTYVAVRACGGTSLLCVPEPASTGARLHGSGQAGGGSLARLRDAVGGRSRTAVPLRETAGEAGGGGARRRQLAAASRLAGWAAARTAGEMGAWGESQENFFS